MKLIQAEHVHRSTEHPHCNSFSTVNGMQPVAQGDRACPEPFELSSWTAFGTNSAAKSPTIGSRWPSRRRARTRKHGRGKFFCFSQRGPVAHFSLWSTVLSGVFCRCKFSHSEPELIASVSFNSLQWANSLHIIPPTAAPAPQARTCPGLPHGPLQLSSGSAAIMRPSPQ